MCGSGAWAEGETKREKYVIGISEKAFGKVNVNDASAALKVWAAAIKREQGVHASLETKLLNISAEEIRTLYLNGEFDGYGLTTGELAAMNVRPDHVYLGNRGEGCTIRYVLIAMAAGDTGVAKIPKNRKLVSCDNNQMTLVLPWLQTLVAEQGGPWESVAPTMVKNFSKAILRVFFRQADAAVVTREAFDLACELNPQLRKDLRVLFESPPVVPVAFLLTPSSGDPQDLKTLAEMVLNIGKTPGGKQMLTVIQSSGMSKYPLSALDETFMLLEARDRLRTTSTPLEAQP